MRYVSTLGDPRFYVDFTTSFMAPQPPLGGLFVPKKLPKFTHLELEEIKDMEYYEVAAMVNNKFIDGEIPEDVVLKIMKNTYNFPVPLQEIEPDRYLSWLTRGPTLSYKDLAMVSLGLQYDFLLEKYDQSLFLDTSTTGDTGPSGDKTIEPVSRILGVTKYPKVTPRFQKLQMTTSKSVAIEFDSSFDYILDLQKRLAHDEDVKKAVGRNTGTLNSTNHQRITNEITYYAKHWADLAEIYGNDVKPIFVVPFGNGSNVCSADYARRMGVPMEKIVIASNSNDTVVRFLKTGKYEPKPKVKTHATAMDITRPNNWKRTTYLFGGVLDDNSEKILKMPDMNAMRSVFEGYSIDNKGIEEAMKRLLNEHDVFICPHGAVAEQSAEKFIKKYKPKQPVVSFMTADPAKFFETVTGILGVEPPVPDSLRDLENKKQHSYKINKKDIDAGRDYSIYKQIVLDAVAESGLF